MSDSAPSALKFVAGCLSNWSLPSPGKRYVIVGGTDMIEALGLDQFASAANAGAFLQTSLSEVTRRSGSRPSSHTTWPGHSRESPGVSGSHRLTCHMSPTRILRQSDGSALRNRLLVPNRGISPGWDGSTVSDAGTAFAIDTIPPCCDDLSFPCSFRCLVRRHSPPSKSRRPRRRRSCSSANTAQRKA